MGERDLAGRAASPRVAGSTVEINEQCDGQHNLYGRKNRRKVDCVDPGGGGSRVGSRGSWQIGRAHV